MCEFVSFLRVLDYLAVFLFLRGFLVVFRVVGVFWILDNSVLILGSFFCVDLGELNIWGLAFCRGRVLLGRGIFKRRIRMWFYCGDFNRKG